MTVSNLLRVLIAERGEILGVESLPVSALKDKYLSYIKDPRSYKTDMLVSWQPPINKVKDYTPTIPANMALKDSY